MHIEEVFRQIYTAVEFPVHSLSAVTHSVFTVLGSKREGDKRSTQASRAISNVNDDH